MSLECASCGRRLSNDESEPAHAHWTLDPFNIGGRLAYCGDSPECERDAYRQLGIEIPT